MTTVPATWQAELASAFEILLGRPLGDFPGEDEYALYYWDDLQQHDILDGLLAGTPDPESVVRGELLPGEPLDEDDAPFNPAGGPLDLGRSLWLFDEAAFDTEGGFGGALGTALRAVSVTAGESERAVSGTDFARVLAAHAEELAEVDGEELTGMVRLLLRIGTDGTLFDAMRAATCTTGGPDTLAAFEEGVEVAPEWEERLSRIPDPRLRDHLRMLSLGEEDARCDGAYFLGPGTTPVEFEQLAARPGHHPVTGWEFGEGQASCAVFRLPASEAPGNGSA
ncbi:hypothetical protein ACWDR0_17740 [Streptomyces sp. NPDC003691]